MQPKKIKIPLIIGGLILVITIGAGITLALINANDSLNQAANSINDTSTSNSNSTNSANNISSGGSESSTSNNSNNSSSLNFKDGTYSATGSYSTPDGSESITVKATIKNNNIEDVIVTSNAKDRESQQYNRLFISGIKGVVVGKPITTKFAPRNVNGASLTINGFDKAISNIRTQASLE